MGGSDKDDLPPVPGTLRSADASGPIQGPAYRDVRESSPTSLAGVVGCGWLVLFPPVRVLVVFLYHSPGSPGEVIQALVFSLFITA